MTDGDGRVRPRVWVWCVDCGHRCGMVFHNPRSVYCDACGQLLGEATEAVKSGDAALQAPYQVIVDANSGDVLSGIQWNADRVTICGEKDG